MLLAIDIGNTQLVLGIFKGDQLVHSWRVVTRRNQTFDEYAVLFRNLFELEGISSKDIEGMVISSVVPPLNKTFESLAKQYFSLDPLFIEATRQNLVPIPTYKPPADVGADRIVNAMAAFDLIGGPSIVVDFGTATTFDAISGKGEYLGGVIAPGISISAEALFSRASKLPRIEIRKPSKVIGDSTVGSMQSGLYFGYVGLVEGILGKMKGELGEAQVLATGGLASLVAAATDAIDRVEEDLTLFGLRLFHSKLN
ncbi:MAG: type III pantothenate kinase [Acidobacteria bacterium]|nr:type III pantothenate kinase [Acidobacteriota bacterium]